MIEILATFFGLAQGALIMLNKRCNWICYVFQMVLMFAFSLQNHLYGDVVNSSIYVVMGIVGWIRWGNGIDAKITSESRLMQLVYGILIAIAVIIVSSYLKTTDDPLPTLDAFTTVTSFVATYLMVRHRLQAWVLWFMNDIAYCIEYFMLPDQALFLFGLNIIWSVMAVVTYVIWSKKMYAQKD